MGKNIFYFHTLNSIGGIETFFYNIVKKYADKDIDIYCKQGDANQIRRLQKYVRVRKWNGQRIACEKAFFNYNADIIDYVDAKEYYMIIHGDYKALGIKKLPVYPQITKYIGVSQHVCDTFSELSGKTVECVYNPLVIEKPKKVLHLISATRLTAEKGKGRMIKLANALDDEGIPYTWTIYTTDPNAFENKNIVCRLPRLDILDYVADADYLVQLSDSEGYSYSILEALTVGTPVIITDIPVAKEMGVINGKNGFVLPFDMSKIPIKTIYKGLPKVNYTPYPDKYDELLADGENQYKKDMHTKVEIRCTKDYFDLEFKRNVKKGEYLTVSKIRAETIIDSGFAEWR